MQPVLKAWSRYFAAAVLLGCAAVPLVSVAVEPDEAPVSQKLNEELRGSMKKSVVEGKVEGMIHLVVLDGKRVCRKMAGSRDTAGKKPFQADTIVRIYSMRKPLTAVAAMTLFDKGKFKLD